MATLKVYLDKRSMKADGTHVLRIAVNHRGGTAFISLSAAVKASEWDSMRCKVKGRTDKDSINRYLTSRLNYYERMMREVVMADGYRSDISARQLRDLIVNYADGRNAVPILLHERWQKYMQHLENSRTREIYAATWARIEEYDGNAKSLTFEDVTREWLIGFFSHMAERSPSVNARNIHLRNIRAIFNDALNDELITCYPFRRFKIRNEETAKRDLTAEEMRHIFSMRCEPWQQRYIDCFRLSFLLIGINVADLLLLPADCIHDGRIVYKRRKTHRMYSILIPTEAMEIIERYRGKELLLTWCEGMKDYRYFSARMNRCLRGLRKGLTSYYARHTWATIAFRIGIPKDVISLALGHADGSKVTSVYIHTDMAVVDDANRKVIDYILS